GSQNATDRRSESIGSKRVFSMPDFGASGRGGHLTFYPSAELRSQELVVIANFEAGNLALPGHDAHRLVAATENLGGLFGPDGSFNSLGHTHLSYCLYCMIVIYDTAVVLCNTFCGNLAKLL